MQFHSINYSTKNKKFWPQTKQKRNSACVFDFNLFDGRLHQLIDTEEEISKRKRQKRNWRFGDATHASYLLNLIRKCATCGVFSSFSFLCVASVGRLNLRLAADKVREQSQRIASFSAPRIYRTQQKSKFAFGQIGSDRIRPFISIEKKKLTKAKACRQTSSNTCNFPI